ncbi:Fmp25p [Cyberlindnera jadinii NRRL Y-1542]|uniref:RCC1/BLIP-II protein n=1 Tax=Cyberlindnera jadinii (strain ATCC 18201 / CBS 1600 / BCRC 20928 / JCM 3617 / NBRC 0987 / NRRL Y-1542) TaxID=983966 RepID=A0A1E4S0F7_CYBJN|nr:RCC1/BLIP-II protein [Cyberlindnera jadinii NRRL Y-1542]ODV72980.1 RCC1/BLIP-II protein [Cyberlindnera jadinii NRRL Y-1542]
MVAMLVRGARDTVLVAAQRMSAQRVGAQRRWLSQAVAARSKRRLTEYEYDDAEMLRSRLDTEPYYAKRDKEQQRDQDPGYDDEAQGASSPDELRRFRRIEIIKGLAAGVATIGGLMGGYSLYANWPRLQAWWYNTGELGFDSGEPGKKRKRGVELPVLTNQNDSSVPGLYLWGDNTEYITSMNKNAVDVRFPMRHDWFDGKYLSCVELGDTSALAIDTHGDLIQWGRGFNGGSTPEVTIRGEALRSAKFSNGIIYALNKHNEVLIIPESKENQASLAGLQSRNWLLQKVDKPFTKLALAGFDKGETVRSFDVGKSHLVLITDKGRAFTCATGFEQLSKSFGQFGIPQFSHLKTPPKPNKLYEIVLLNQVVHYNSKNKIDHVENRVIEKVACGNNHTMALDSNGELFTFGQNTYGQLAHPVSYETEHISYPKKVDILNKHVKRAMFPEVLDIHAGGDTSFCEVKPVHMYQLVKGSTSQRPQVDDESFVVGFGTALKGQIGNGLFIHAQFDPVRLKELEKFQDFNEATGEMDRIHIKEWSSGEEHSFVKLDNSDVLYWGANDYGQLGTGKKNRIPKPTSPPSLIEPSFTADTYKDLTFANRLQLSENQHIVAGAKASAIYYTPK